MKNKKMRKFPKRKSLSYVNLAFVLLIFAALAVSAYAQAAQTAKPAPTSIAKLAFLGKWQYIIINALIIFAVLFVAQAALLHGKEGKEKSVAWMLALVISVALSWFISSDGFIWQNGIFGKYAQYANIKLIVNTLIITLVLWFGVGFLNINTGDKKEKKVGIILLILFVSVMIAFNIGDAWLWSHKTVQFFYDYLFGDEITVGRGPLRQEKEVPAHPWLGPFGGKKKIIEEVPGKGEDITVGGILTLKSPRYRLAIFILSTLLLKWFFTSLIDLKDNKLSWVIVIILSATLARRGAPLTIVFAMLEIFLLIVIGKALSAGTGSLGAIMAMIFTIVLVEFLFCIVFGSSAISTTIAQSLSNLPLLKNTFESISHVCERVNLGMGGRVNKGQTAPEGDGGGASTDGGGQTPPTTERGGTSEADSLKSALKDSTAAAAPAGEKRWWGILIGGVAILATIALIVLKVMGRLGP